MKDKKVMKEFPNPDSRTNPASNSGKISNLKLRGREKRENNQKEIPDFRWIRVAEETVSY